MAKLSQHFSLEELVPEYIFKRFGQSSTWFIDRQLLEFLEWFRTTTGWRLKINDWHTGGSHQNRGYRMPDSSVGGSLSQHKFGRAADISSPDATCQQMWDWIFAHETECIAHGLTCVEDIEATKTWIHLDIRFVASPQTKLLIVKP